MLKAIHAQESRDAPEQKARMIIEELKARKMSKAAELVEQAVNETLTYYETLTYWQKIRTNNPLERIMKKFGAERVWSAPSRTANHVSISLQPGSATSQHRLGR